MGLFDKAKEFVSDPDNVSKAREQLTDENVDAASDKLKEFAPDKADGAIDSLGTRAKEWGGPEDSGQERPGGQREAGRGNDDGPRRDGGGGRD